MGIYIPGMEMPKDCLKCPFCLFADGYWKCLVDGSHADFGGTCRPSLCPLVPVPPHGRLGDLDELLKEENRIYDQYDAGIISEITCMNALAWAIRNATTIIPAEEGE